MATIREILERAGHKVGACCSYAHHLETGILHFRSLPCDVRQKIVADCGQILTEACLNLIEETGELMEMEVQTLHDLMEDIRALEELGEKIDAGLTPPAAPAPGSQT